MELSLSKVANLGSNVDILKMEYRKFKYMFDYLKDAEDKKASAAGKPGMRYR